MSTDTGPKGMAVIRWIAEHPYCSKAEAAKGAGASRDSVERLIRRGVVIAEETGYRYRLYLACSEDPAARRDCSLDLHQPPPGPG